MAVDATVISEDSYHVLLEWTLTSADDEANPSPAFPHRSEKSVDVYEAGASGWGTGTIQIHGDLYPSDTGNFKLLNTIPSDTDLSFAAADSTYQYVVLPNVTRIKPVKSAGSLGANGVKIALLVVSDVKRFR